MQNEIVPSDTLDLMPMNNRKRELIDQVLKQEEIFHSLLKTKGTQDLYIFNKYILKIEDGKSPLVDFHKNLCRFVTDDMKKKKLLLLPRGHLKSTLITIGYSLFRIINNPNIRILIRNATWQMAVDFLTEIKRHLTSNELLIKLFGDLTIGRDEWSQDRITLKRSDTGVKGPTVWATGIESNLVGAHPDLIIDDDLVNRDNISTPEQIEKVILRYKDTLDLLEPGGQYIVIGTRWTEGDLYSWILDKENNISQSYDVMIKKAYTGNLETGQDFVPLWPEKFTQQELLTRLREKGWYEFSAQYLNDPVPDATADFKKDWFQYYDFTDIRGKEMYKVLTIDPAISLEKEADFTALVVSGIDTFGNIFVLDIDRGHYTPNQIIEHIFSLNELYHPSQIGIETVAYQKALAYTLRDEMNKRNRYLPFTELKTESRSKVERIRGLQPLYENRKIFHRKGLPNLTYFEYELTTFPRGRKDDLIDAFSYAKDLLVIPRKKSTRFQHQYLY